MYNTKDKHQLQAKSSILLLNFTGKFTSNSLELDINSKLYEVINV